ncbi:hypothetical protein VNO78_07441 [Psophocarpus tetragonolobus]|uniref:PUM-HD domain-containing protein n=1 Tax=Psophocarpus tetragonolobus TaxID=3891 RepID=A0AAN9XSR7_PSOTE
MEKFSTASLSQEIKYVDSTMYTPPQNHQEGFPSPLIRNLNNFDSQWLNSISVDAIACSVGRLCLCGLASISVDPTSTIGQLNDNNTLLCVPNFSTRHRVCCQYCGQLVQRYNLTSLEDVKVGLASLAQAPHQHLGKPKVIEMILCHVKDHLCDLMMDQYYNYLILSIFEASNEKQITKILDLVIKKDHKFKELCMHDHRTQIIKKLFEYLNMPGQVSTAIFAMKRNTVRLSKNINGGYVIQHCLKLFSPMHTRSITEELARNCVEISTNKVGCSVIQKCLHEAKGEALRQLIDGIARYAFVLARHPFGNYVVQYIVKMKIPHINATIIHQLLGRYAQLSINKYSSNVVEHLLEFSEEKDVAIIIQEIMYNHNFLGILQDPYGNYVVKRALQNCKGNLYKIFSASILFNYPHLHTHFYGKKVLAFIQRRNNYIRRPI